MANPWDAWGSEENWRAFGPGYVDPTLARQELFSRYGFREIQAYDPSGNQVSNVLAGNGDFAALQADPAYQALPQKPIVATPEQIANAANPNGRGNNEGGSDLSNIAMGLSFIGGGYGLGQMSWLPGGSESALSTLSSTADAPWGVTTGPSPGMEDYAARVAAEDAVGGTQYLQNTGQTYNGFLQNVDKLAGVAGGVAGGAAGGSLAAKTAIGRVLSGTASAADYASALGGIAGIGSGLYGMNLAKNIGAPQLPSVATLSGLSTGGGMSIGAPPLSTIGGGGASTVGAVSSGAVDLSGVDPWGDIGGRILAGNQLKGLLTDPSSITSMPDYEAGMQAVERSLASQGYQGSGNMMAAMQKYGGQFYNQALSRLSALAGTNQDPAVAAKLALQQQQTGVQARGQDLSYILGQGAQQLTNQGQQMNYALGGAKLGVDSQLAAAQLSSQALGSAGYGVQSLFGNGGIQLTPGVLKLLQGVG